MQRFITTVPKTGSHLLWHILDMDKEQSTVQDFHLQGKYHKCRFYENGITGHIPWTPAAVGLGYGMQRFTMLRDPRDVIVSWHYYMDKVDEGHPFYTYAAERALKDFTGDERLTVIISALPTIFRDFIPWLQEDILVLRYEDLINGPQTALKDTAEAIGESLERLVERSRYRGSETFRKGQPGSWRQEFKGEHLGLFDELYGEIMEAWGYDPD